MKLCVYVINKLSHIELFYNLSFWRVMNITAVDNKI